MVTRSNAAARRLRLDDQLCFALYAATNGIVRSYRPLLQKLGLTYPQYLAMMVLWERDDVATGFIAGRLMLPVHAVLPVLTRLEAGGLIVRRRDESNRRLVRVSLTAAGADLEVAAATVQQEVVCDTGLDDGSLGDLRDRLRQLADDLDSAHAAKRHDLTTTTGAR